MRPTFACGLLCRFASARKGPDPFRSAFEELFDFVEPTFGARVVARAVLLADGFELAQDLALAFGEVDGRFDHHVAEEIARRLTSHALDALRFQAEGAAALRLGRHADLGRAVERRDGDLAAERGRGDGDRHLAMQVVVVARENRVRLDVHLHVEIARRAAVHARLALAGEPHAIAFVDAGGDLHRERLLQLDAADTRALHAGVRNDAARAVAARAGLRDGERSLRNAHLTSAAAGRASRGLGARPRACALADVAG